MIALQSRHSHLNLPPCSLDHKRLVEYIVQQDNLLIIQDLDGVCMGLTRNPLDRQLDSHYIQATHQLDGHFFVLTNGEHGGQFGVNALVDRAIASDPSDKSTTAQPNRYLPGLAAGGVQWQTCAGDISHPGVSAQELAFLAQVPEVFAAKLTQFFDDVPGLFGGKTLERVIQNTVLNNVASPTVNLHEFYDYLRDCNRLETYRSLQQMMRDCCSQLLIKAERQGLADSFFVHYSPNDGRNKDGRERLRLARTGDSGTTDFQFLLRGAVKETGVVVLLNQYYGQRTGHYPLGEGFNVRQAPRSLPALLELVQDNFDGALMPVIIGIGDTITSRVEQDGSKRVTYRGGSDRLFLQLIQNIGRAYDRGNVVVYVDSSGGEIQNRKPVKIERRSEGDVVIEGPGDPADGDDPLTLDVVFPGGHGEYIETFLAIAHHRSNR